jgi:hypothetical protein
MWAGCIEDRIGFLKRNIRTYMGKRRIQHNPETSLLHQYSSKAESGVSSTGCTSAEKEYLPSYVLRVDHRRKLSD